MELFDYLEPAEQNLGCYSYRIHELLLRACIEVEANCKAILLENGYTKTGDLRMGDYIKIGISHRLSEYTVRMPTWTGVHGTRTPFSAWTTSGSLRWYQAYNATKHDRHAEFKNATFENMLDAVCGCVAILSAQFRDHDYSPQSGALLQEGSSDGMSDAIGGYFRVGFPQSWPASERYDFDWVFLRKTPTLSKSIGTRSDVMPNHALGDAHKAARASMRTLYLQNHMTEDKYQISEKAQYIKFLLLKDELEYLDGVLSDVIADHEAWLTKLRATRSVFLTLNNVKDAADRIQNIGDEDFVQKQENLKEILSLQTTFGIEA